MQDQADEPSIGSEANELGVVDLEVIVPVLNEERRIGETLERLVRYLVKQPWSSRVTIVDNGCTDRTTELIDSHLATLLPIRVIGCRIRGKGAAVRRGMLAARARRVGFCDADLSTPVETIAAAMSAIDEGYPVAIGSRRCEGAAYLAEQSLVRRAGGLAFRSLAHQLAPQVADTQCGFKFFESSAAQQLFALSQAERFAFDVEILALAASEGMAVREIPVHWSDSAGSTFRLFTDGHASFRELCSVRQRINTRSVKRGSATVHNIDFDTGARRQNAMVPVPAGD